MHSTTTLLLQLEDIRSCSDFYDQVRSLTTLPKKPNTIVGLMLRFNNIPNMTPSQAERRTTSDSGGKKLHTNFSYAWV